MAGILVYALHDDEGNFNKNSLGAISEAAKLAGELGSEAAAIVVCVKRLPKVIRAIPVQDLRPVLIVHNHTQQEE